jgi:hypothetical protein
MKQEDFFTDLALIAAQGFFDDVSELKASEIREARRRTRDVGKAHRIYPRLLKVREFDSWDKTKHIEPDFFGDKHEQFKAVKTLELKRRRIEWILWAMYHSWMFGVPCLGTKKYGSRYSMYRKLWYKHAEALAEQMKQQFWDRKRERVRSRRNKVKKRNSRKTAEETLAVLKASRLKVQEVIDSMEVISQEGNIWDETQEVTWRGI